MSGSGGGGGGGGLDRAQTSCETLTDTTVLNSPNSSVVPSLKKGDVLTLAARPSGNSVIVEARQGNRVAGSITSAIIQRLIECMKQGHEYVAEVLENAQGGACKVFIHHKPK